MRSWGKRVRSAQSGCGTGTCPSHFAYYKIPFCSGHWILFSSIFFWLPLTCSCHSRVVVTQPTFQLPSALPSASLLLRRWGGSCTGWALFPALHCRDRGNVWRRAGAEGRVPGAEATLGSSTVLMSLNIVHLIPAWGSKRGSAHGSGWEGKICETWESLSYLQPTWGMHLGMWGWKEHVSGWWAVLWERNVS